MRIDYINPFVESAFSVMHEILGCEIKRGDLYLKGKTQSILGVATIVGLAGSVEGRVILDMKTSTALAIASAMNFEELTVVDDLVQATITELANIITGRAVSRLHEMGFKFDITPPAIITGEGTKIHDAGIEALIVPLEMPLGKVEVNVAIKERG
ncbi:MAG: chemotaxis protein CheX [Spirochaetaceae bacterium]|nr:chemotaxis protein CheX [Spirochaetaceae bacterium]